MARRKSSFLPYSSTILVHLLLQTCVTVSLLLPIVCENFEMWILFIADIEKNQNFHVYLVLRSVLKVSFLFERYTHKFVKGFDKVLKKYNQK